MKRILGFVSVILGLLVFASPVFADSLSVNFEPSTYTLGNINGQDGWMKTGAFDVEVVNNTFGFSTFGSQSLRLSDAVTSGSFGDQTFAKPLTDAVGEADSTDGTFSRGVLQPHFEMQFDIASISPNEQPGMHMSVSPDRGDGSRMSYLRFEDSTNGINVFFDDVQGTSNPANFVETQIATDLSRTAPHTVKLTFDALDGPSNDVVKVWIDGVLKITGTSWENYYRFDSESSAEQSPRIVKTVLFRESGAANLADQNNGFLVDNLSLLSGPIPTPTPAVMLGSATGGLRLSGPKQQISFNAFDYGQSSDDKGQVEYQNFEYPGGLHYTANVLCANVKQATNEAWFMFQIPDGFPSLSGLYVVSHVADLATPGTKGDIYGHTASANLAEATSWCENGTAPVGNYAITGGNAVVHK